VKKLTELEKRYILDKGYSKYKNAIQGIEIKSLRDFKGTQDISNQEKSVKPNLNSFNGLFHLLKPNSFPQKQYKPEPTGREAHLHI